MGCNLVLSKLLSVSHVLLMKLVVALLRSRASSSQILGLSLQGFLFDQAMQGRARHHVLPQATDLGSRLFKTMAAVLLCISKIFDGSCRFNLECQTEETKI